MFLRLFIFFFGMVCNVSLFSQAIISGKIRDGKNRPVGGASIAIKDSYDGATSDSLGNFHFSTTEKGAQVLFVTSIGFKPLDIPVTVSDQPLIKNIQLREEPNELTAVTINAGSFEAG